MVPPSPAGGGKALWGAQVLVAHGIRALREAQSVVIGLSDGLEPEIVDQVHAMLATAVEHANIAYRALTASANE